MPTGYTADIAKGIDFKTFAMNCARAFGACITLRDDPGGGEAIPERFTADDYHARQCENAKRRLRDLLALTVEDAEKAASAEWSDAEHHRIKTLEDRRTLRNAYEAMAQQVTAWKPPTDDHVGLRDFMLSQISESIRFDCDESYYLEETKRLTGEEWLSQKVASARRDIDYHTAEYTKDVYRAATRSEWVAALRASLKEVA